MQKSTEVQTYFTDRAHLFDALYDDDTGFSRQFNKLFRRPMLTRYVYTLDALGSLEGKRILDVGCGAGRYAVELAKKGAHVTGVDFSDEMLAMAKERAAADNVGDKVEFISGDFVTWSEGQEGKFDAVFAMGVLDYIDDAPAFIARMADVAPKVIASFPRPTPVRMPLRKLRYALRNCPVHFYTRQTITDMYAHAGLKGLDVRPLGFAGYWVEGNR